MQFWSEMVREGNETIIGGKYSQTPFGDFWTDSGTFFCSPENDNNHENVQGPENRFLFMDNSQKLRFHR